ncbi:hypothetical protein K432DRAFT_188138 [Lepidopterella palustris CBS 459.81]|uniref:Uncharacterized protein n=1 Tax=Lepidopterella palustris CBS 459.81 TaxID=1314670 RepID=A0A8E2EGV3_9PEZI|nr:hypothetical protein K432DRAFT_188138 [Lepidopterella palustris CBS 459.81]
MFVPNGITASFTDVQDPSLASFSGTTTISTMITASESGSTTSSLVPVIIGPAGFYWKPLPKPRLQFPPVPPMPTPPPGPKQSCFKIGGIFSIDCPPSGGGGVGGGGGGNPTPGDPNTTQKESDKASTGGDSSQTTLQSSSTQSSSSSSSSSSRSCIANSAQPTDGLTGRGEANSCSIDKSHVVYPEDFTNTGQTSAISNTLNTLVKDPSLIYASTGDTQDSLLDIASDY